MQLRYFLIIMLGLVLLAIAGMTPAKAQIAERFKRDTVYSTPEQRAKQGRESQWKRMEAERLRDSKIHLNGIYYGQKTEGRSIQEKFSLADYPELKVLDGDLKTCFRLTGPQPVLVEGGVIIAKNVMMWCPVLPYGYRKLYEEFGK